MYSSYTAELHQYSRCLPFILCTNHEFPMESARLKLMLSYEQYTLKLEELLIQSLHYCLAPLLTSFSQHQLPSIPDYDFTLLAGIAFLDHVCFLSIILARVELMRSVPSPHAQHTALVGGSARLKLMQAPHIIHCYGCVHFLLVTCIHLPPSVLHFLHVVYHFFIVLRATRSAVRRSPSSSVVSALLHTVHKYRPDIAQHDLQRPIPPAGPRPPHSQKPTISAVKDPHAQHRNKRGAS